MMEASSPGIAYSPSAGFSVGLALSGDERLAKLVASGNERAFAVLFERYHGPLYRYCCSILRHEVDAQDALQSTFAGALVALRRGQRDAPLRPWLFRIAHNESISLLRRRRPLGQELSEGLEPQVASAEERVQERERLGLLVADLQELPDRQRGALVMRELSGLSHEEIAAALGTSPATAKQAIFEARSALLEFAEGRAMSCEEICRRISDGDRRALRGRRVRAHLRECGSCAAFAAAIPARRADLHALAAPIAPLAAAGMLGRLSGGGTAAAGAGGRAAGTVAGKLAGVGLTGKALVTTVVVTGAAAGVAGTLVHVHHVLAAPGPAALSATRGAPAAGHASASGQGSGVVLEPSGVRRGIVHYRTGQHNLRASRIKVGSAVNGHASIHGRSRGWNNPVGGPSRSHGLGNSAHGNGRSALKESSGQSSRDSAAASRGGSSTSHRASTRGSTHGSAHSSTAGSASATAKTGLASIRHTVLKQGQAAQKSSLHPQQ